jgi:hypothetical protein
MLPLGHPLSRSAVASVHAHLGVIVMDTVYHGMKNLIKNRLNLLSSCGDNSRICIQERMVTVVDDQSTMEEFEHRLSGWSCL